MKFFETIPTDEVSTTPRSAEQEMWLAVLELALVECFNPRCVYEKNAVLKTYWLQRYAQHWVFRSPDFLLVCEYAGVDPEFVRSLVRQRLDVPPAKKPRPQLRNRVGATA